MTTNAFTVLNLGKGGNAMDETIVTYTLTPDEIAAGDPEERRRARVVVAGCLPDQLADVLDIDPCELTPAQHGLVTRNIPCGIQDVAPQLPGDTVAVFGEVTSVSDASETTVVSHVVSVGKTFHLIGFTATGNVPACFIAFLSPAATFLSSERILMGRTAVTTPFIQVSTEMATPTASAGTTVAVRVEHSVASLPAGASTEFQVTLLGYEI